MNTVLKQYALKRKRLSKFLLKRVRKMKRKYPLRLNRKYIELNQVKYFFYETNYLLIYY